MFKLRISYLTVMAIILMMSAIFAVVPPAEGFEVGDTLLVKWSQDNYWYPATIVNKEGGRYFVRFHDGDEEWTNPFFMKVEDIREGDRVFGNYQNGGKYYPGRVTQRNGPAIHIIYDDGDEEDTTISFVRVLR
jgi:hypothetical protein